MLILTGADVKPCRIRVGEVEQLGFYYRHQLYRYVNRFPAQDMAGAVRACRASLDQGQVSVLVKTNETYSLWLRHQAPVQQRQSLTVSNLEGLLNEFGDQTELPAELNLQERFKQYINNKQLQPTPTKQSLSDLERAEKIARLQDYVRRKQPSTEVGVSELSAEDVATGIRWLDAKVPAQ